MDDDNKIKNINGDSNTGQIQTTDDGMGLFAANNLLRRNEDNLAASEAMIDDEVLRTEKTTELEEYKSDEE